MRLVVTRHGETEENARQIIQGQTPGHLSTKGIQQSKDLAQELKNEHFDQAWSSDLQRCVDTANYIVAPHPDLKLQTTKQLRELNYGDFQGRPASEIDWDSLVGPYLQQRFPNGETRLEMANRIVAFINQLYQDFPDQKILVVTHGGPTRVIMAAVAGESLNETLEKDAPNAQGIYLEVTKLLQLIV